MKKKSKKKHKKKYQRLKWYDKWAYYGLLLLGISAIFGLLFGFFCLQRTIAFRNPNVTVYNTGPTTLTFLIPLLSPFIVGMVLWNNAWMQKKPIFGPKMPTPDYKKRIFFRTKAGKKVLYALISLWCLSLILPIGSLWDRTELSNEGITNYGLFGYEQEHQPLSEVKSTHLRIYYSWGRHSGWKTVYTLYFNDGTKESFEMNPQCLSATDALFEGIPKTVEGASQIEDAYHMPEARALVHAVVDKMTPIDN